jgi:hypothetical protein
MPVLFAESRLKVEWAMKHVNDLSRILTDFAKGYAHEVFIEHDPDGGDDVLKVRQGTLPTEFLLTLGDALHNLRTALDYAMNEIEFLTVGKRATFTKFPVYDTRNGLENAANGGLKQKAPEKIIKCILDGIQPYAGGKGFLIWALHTLDIEDKHRLLITKSEVSLIRGITVEDDAGVERHIGNWLAVNNQIADFGLNGMRNAKVKNKGQPSLNILFGNSPPLPLAPVFGTVHRMTAQVIDALDQMDIAYHN